MDPSLDKFHSTEVVEEAVDTPTNGAEGDQGDVSHAGSADASSIETQVLGASATTRSRLQYRREYLNLDEELVYTEEFDSGKVVKQDSAYAIIVTETCFTNQGKNAYNLESEKGRPPRMKNNGSTFIEIRSQAVIDALRTVIGYYPDHPFTGDTVRLLDPYAPLFHYRKELQEYHDHFASRADEAEPCQQEKHLCGDLNLLLEVYEELCGDDVRDEIARHNLPIPRCSYDMLWTLFKPGEDAYLDYRINNDYVGVVVKSMFFTYSDKKASDYLLRYWWMNCNDVYVGPGEARTNTMRPFAGEKEIADLEIFPRRFMRKDKHGTTDEEHFETLAKRGEMYFNLLKGPQFVWFDGLSASFPPTAYRGRAMVDMHQYAIQDGDGFAASYVLANDIDRPHVVSSRCHCTGCKELSSTWAQRRISFAGYTEINPLKVSELGKHQRFLCRGELDAYLLKQRAWRRLRVDGFSQPSFQRNLINTLVIPEGTRQLLQSLCRKFTSSVTWSADFIEGKGEGNIILLHGKPGVGKTYTAECVAEEVERPLISLTCADIGTDSTVVEERLTKWFELAKAWSAILLLDEADVFLERRSSSDLKRNNLVAIFLRTLEYYQGILFLTTNRVGTFDEAFLSRIDVPIYFSALTEQNRLQIWQNLFTKLEKERTDKIRVSADVRYYIKEDRDLQDLKWNGREIRSGFQTAVALAEIEGLGKDDTIITVRNDHIATVVEMSKDFKRYLENLHQQSPDDLAASMKLRYDPSRGGPRKDSGSLLI